MTILLGVFLVAFGYLWGVASCMLAVWMGRRLGRIAAEQTIEGGYRGVDYQR